MVLYSTPDTGHTYIKGTMSPYRHPTVLNLASRSVVNCEFLHPRWAATITSDHRNALQQLYHRLESQDSNTDISQLINATKAVQAKTAVTPIDGLN